MTWITFSSLKEYWEQNLQIKHYLLTSIQNSFFSGNLEIVLLREYNICRIKTNLKFSLWKSEFFRHFTSTCPSYHHVQERLVLTTRVLSPLKVAQKAPAFPFAELTTQIWQHKYDRVRSGCLQLPLNCRGTTEGLWRRDGNKEATKACIARIPQRAPDTTRESLLYRGTGTVPMFILVTITSRSYLHIINDSADGFYYFS